MTTQPMEALKPERPFERHDLGNGWYVERSGQHSTTWWIGHPDKSTEAIWKIDASYTMGEFRDFIAAMNTRSATGGLRLAAEKALAKLKIHRSNGDMGSILGEIHALEDALAATPQAEAAPPVLPSDEECAEKLQQVCTADGMRFDDVFLNNATRIIAAHRTAHQNAADDGWRDIESAPHEEDVLLYIPANEITPFKIEAGWASGGKITYLSNGQSVSNKWFHGSATHWRPLPTPPSKGRVE